MQRGGASPGRTRLLALRVAALARRMGGVTRAATAWQSGLASLWRALDALPQAPCPQAWLVAICLALFLPGFFSIQPLDLGETDIAVATRAMLEGGSLLGIPPGDAGPIGIHWLQAAAVRALEALHLAHRHGIPAYRLVSLLGAVLAVLATWHWGRALVGRSAAFLGAGMLAGCAMLVAMAHLATAEAAGLAAATAAMGLFAAAYVGPARVTAGQAAGFWLAVAAGLLLAGPVALLPPLLAGLTLAAADRRAPWLRALRPLQAPLLLAGLVLAWRAAGGDLPTPWPGLAAGEPQPGRHLLLLAATAFPAGWILLLALPAAWRERQQPAVRFLLAWAGPAWLAFELMPWGIGAVLPLFPALMLLAARWAMGGHRPPVVLLVIAGQLLAAAAGAIAFKTFEVAGLDIRELPYGVLAILAATLLVWRLLAHGRARAWARAALLGTLLAAPLYAAVLQGTLSHLPVARIADRIAGTAWRVAPDLRPGQFGVLGFDRASLPFAFGGAVQGLEDGPAAARFLAAAPGRVVAIADLREGQFRRAAEALGLEVEEAATILSFDPYIDDFGIMIFYRAAGAAAGR